ncbi:hypothetical protein [Pelagicoccus sp. SDUM812005]|uniref:hypothetical protein n=1 Tax=Pelagicoccus sp. SDUM812005 TaxID=3041257 RepID=UPI00280E133A|nr:hypothetical protein [Pelagicoccus sp. SDUM812005]MDQ8183413.1 hypothetical protein [Pelagicoccus sp. SDUM812005]
MVEEERIEELLGIAKSIGYGEIPPYQHNECFTSGAFDLVLVRKGQGFERFELLEEVCRKYEEVRKDEKHLEGYFYLLNQLAHLSDTTELPYGMKRIIDENEERSKELKKWYRI